MGDAIGARFRQHLAGAIRSVARAGWGERKGDWAASRELRSPRRVLRHEPSRDCVDTVLRRPRSFVRAPAFQETHMLRSASTALFTLSALGLFACGTNDPSPPSTAAVGGFPQNEGSGGASPTGPG